MASPARPARPYFFLLAIWAVNVCSNAFYIAPANVFPQMRADLGISNAQAGLLISSYLVAIMVFQIPAGYVIDRRDSRPVIVLGSAVVLVISVLTYLFPRYDAMLALRFLAGIPVAFVFVPSAFLVSQAFSDHPGRAVGVFLSAPPTGVTLGNFLDPFVAQAFGWPAVFIAYTLPWLVLLPLFAISARNLPVRPAASFSLSDYGKAFWNRELWKVGAIFACSYAAYIFFASWSLTYLTDLGVASAALLGFLTAAIPAAGILSRPLGGFLAETRFDADKRRVAMIGFVALAAGSLAIPFLGLGSAPLLIAGGFFAQFPFSVYYILSAKIMPERFTGSAYALMNSISLIGGAISPALAGYLLDVTGSFFAAFAMMAATALLGLVIIAFTRER